MADVELIVNFPREEAYAPAWSAFHTAGGLNFTTFRTNHALGGLIAEDGILPSAFWREPVSGVIMLKPTLMLAGRLATGFIAAMSIAFSGWDFGGTSEGATGAFSYAAHSTADPGLSGYQALSPKLKSRTDTRLALSGLGFIKDFMDLPELGGQMVWHARTQQLLAANQPFAYTVAPSGIYGDQAGDYFAVGFGAGNLVLHHSMDGVVKFFADASGSGDFVVKDTFNITAGGVNHTLPYQVTVVPFGQRFISVQFTQNSDVGAGNASDRFNAANSGWLIILPHKGPNAPVFDATLNQWVKTQPGQIHVGLRKQVYDYNFFFMKGVYPTGVSTLYTSREYLRLPPGAGNLNYRFHAFQGQRETGGSAAGINTVTGYNYVRNDKNLDFDENADKVALIQFDFNPSASPGATGFGLYTPELWNCRLKAGPVIATPDLTSHDASTQWQLVRFIRTTDTASTAIEVKVTRDGDMPVLLKRDGPLRINVINNSGDSQVAAEGYITRAQPTIEGHNGLITDQIEARDMWRRLKKALHLDSVEGTVVAEAMKAAIMDCGFHDEDVFIDYENCPELANITFGDLVNPNDVLQPNEDTTTEDWLRSICDKITAQFRPPMRVRWLPDQTTAGHMLWVIYLGPIYDETATDLTFENCHHRLFLDHQFCSWQDFASETDRYLASEFIGTGNLEFTIEEPPFNALQGGIAVASNLQTHPERSDAYIAPDPRVLTDPSYVGYQGYEDLKTMSTEKLSLTLNVDSLPAALRSYYDLNYNLKALSRDEIEGEWQPEIDCDQFMQIIGVANFADVDRGIAVGDPISFGAWRIDHIDIEMRHDGALNEDSAPRRWEWYGSYTFVFVGKSTGVVNFPGSGGDFPLKMFAPDDLLPLVGAG